MFVTSFKKYAVRPIIALLVGAFIVASLPLNISSVYASPGYQTETAPSTPNNSNSQPENENSLAQQILEGATPDEREELSEILAKIEQLEAETELAAENYNASRARLDRIREDMKTAQERYDLVSKAYELQKIELGKRLSDQYRNGGLSFFQILFESKTFSEALRNIQYLLQMSESDSRLLKQVSDDKKSLEDTLSQLARDEKDAISLEFELKARSIEIKERNRRQQQTLESQSARVQQLIGATRTTQAAEESALAAQIAMGRLSQVRVEPGSPVETALKYRGIKYVWAGESKKGFDCSGLVLYVFRQHGVNLPHHSGTQYGYGVPVTGSLLPGDVVFFGRPIHHVGIYIGGDYFVHAPRTGDVVKISKLSSMNNYVGARRYNWDKRIAPIQ